MVKLILHIQIVKEKDNDAMELMFRFLSKSLASMAKKVNVFDSAICIYWKWLKLIKLSPQTECFLWRLLNNAIPTYDFLTYRRLLEVNSYLRGCIAWRI